MMLKAETASRLGTATLTVQLHYIRLAVDVMQGSGVLRARWPAFRMATRPPP